jgi:CHAT domain-containing protein/tetratricopeptide (TPR) repeat protein
MALLTCRPLLCLLLFLTLTAMTHHSAADEAKPKVETPKLKLVFSDDFKTDSRQNYQVHADVTWKPGRLQLAQDSSFSKKVNTAWAKVGVELRELAANSSVLSARFQMEKKTSFAVEWARFEKDGKPQQRVIVWGTVDINGRRGMKRIASREVLGRVNPAWEIHYRFGVISVFNNGEKILGGYLVNHEDEIKQIELKQKSGRSEIVQFSLSALPTPKLTEDQAKELAVARQFETNAGRAYQSRDPQTALKEFAKALRIRRQIFGRHHFRIATALNNMAALNRMLGRYTQSEAMYSEALSVYRNLVGNSHPEHARALNNLGFLYRSMGKFDRVEPLYRQAAEIWRTILGESHPDYLIAIHNLAAIYSATGKYRKAIPLILQESEFIKRTKGETHPEYIDSLVDLGTTYLEIGSIKKAAALLDRAMLLTKQSSGENTAQYAELLGSVASLHRSTGNLKKAVEFNEAALLTFKKLRQEDGESYATCLNNLAGVYHVSGKTVEARKLLEESLNLTRKLLGENNIEYANSLNNLGALCLADGDVSVAESNFQQATKLFKQLTGPEHQFYALCLNNLANLYLIKQDFEKAAEASKESISISRRLLEKTALIQSQREQMQFGRQMRAKLDVFLAISVQSGKYGESAFNEVLSWKGATLVRQRHLRMVSDQAGTRDTFLRLRDITKAITDLLRRPPGVFQKAAWQQKVDRLTNMKDELEAELVAKSEPFRKSQRRIQLNDLMDVLPKDMALVDFLELPNPTRDEQRNHANLLTPPAHFICFVVRHGEPIVPIDLGPAEAINKAVETWRLGFGTTEESAKAGQFLRNHVWKKFEPQLKGIDKVILSPDKALARIPFAALPGSKPGSYLIEEYQLASIAVPQLLPDLLNAPNASKRSSLIGDLLVLGNIDYGTTTEQPRDDSLVGSDFQPLSETKQEIESISQLYTQTLKRDSGSMLALKSSEATETAFLRHAPNYRTIHIATHGFFAEGTATKTRNTTRSMSTNGVGSGYLAGVHPGLLSGLALSGANEENPINEHDGILFAREIAFLPLDGVDLIVLSACETGLGPVAGGEGLLGVQRALQVSGVRTTIASLWKVDDLATRRLMERFYQNLWQNKMNKLAALREAQIWMLRDPAASKGLQTRGATINRKNVKVVDAKDKSGRTSPQFWASFVLSGNWGR